MLRNVIVIHIWVIWLWREVCEDDYDDDDYSHLCAHDRLNGPRREVCNGTGIFSDSSAIR